MSPSGGRLSLYRGLSGPGAAVLCPSAK